MQSNHDAHTEVNEQILSNNINLAKATSQFFGLGLIKLKQIMQKKLQRNKLHQGIDNLTEKKTYINLVNIDCPSVASAQDYRQDIRL